MVSTGVVYFSRGDKGGRHRFVPVQFTVQNCLNIGLTRISLGWSLCFESRKLMENVLQMQLCPLVCDTSSIYN